MCRRGKGCSEPDPHGIGTMNSPAWARAIADLMNKADGFPNRVAEPRYAEAFDIMRELDRTFEGRDADGAPSGDGSYWIGHSLALRIWYWIHPEKIPDEPPSF
jgi:hypothetical protein